MLETGSGTVRVPSTPETAARQIIPAPDRDFVINALKSYHLPDIALPPAAVLALIPLLIRNLFRTLEQRPLALFAAAGALTLAFAHTGPETTFIYVVAAGMAGVAISMAYAQGDRERSGVFYQVVHALAGFAAIVLEQRYMARFNPDDVLPLKVIQRGSIVLFATVSAILVIDVWMRGKRNDEPPADISWGFIACTTWLWMIAALFNLHWTPLPAVYIDDGILHGTIVVLFMFAFYFRNPAVSGALSRKYIFLSRNYRLLDLQNKRDSIPVPSKTQEKEQEKQKSTPWRPIFFELSGFILYAFVPVSVIFAAETGALPPSQVNWWDIGRSTAFFFAFIVLWLAVRDMNQNLAEVIDREIAKEKGKTQ